jgi:hypothetical protein
MRWREHIKLRHEFVRRIALGSISHTVMGKHARSFQ